MFPLAFANRSLDPEVIDVLIESVLVDNERVRRAALNGLKSHVGNDDVRALFETLQEEEPEFADELRIAETLRRHERQLELPPAR
jgi:predicted RNA-binding protein